MPLSEEGVLTKRKAIPSVRATNPDRRVVQALSPNTSPDNNEGLELQKYVFPIEVA